MLLRIVSRANDHEIASNTYTWTWEMGFGWSGVAMEPQQKIAAGTRSFRPETSFVPLFVSDVSNREATLYVTGNDQVVVVVPRLHCKLYGR